MDRRSLLATSGAVVGLATAGCSSLLGSTIDLTNPDRDDRPDGRETHLTYRHDGASIVTVGFVQRTVPASLDDLFGLGITLSHSGDTTLESFQFELRAPQSSVALPADIYLKSPGGSRWTDLTFETVENQWTRIGLEDTGELGEGTMNLETFVRPNTEPATDVGVRIEVALSWSGQFADTTFRVDNSTEFSPVTE